MGKIFALLLLAVSITTFVAIKTINVNRPYAVTLNEPIIVDHNSVALFDQIPDEYLTRARNLRMLFLNRSVGDNINKGLDCLAYPSVGAAPNFCKRPDLVTSELVANAKYNRNNWHYQFLEMPNRACGTWAEKIDCYMEIVRPIINNYDVISYQNSYLEVAQGSTIANSPGGYFYDNPNQLDIYDLERFQNQYPDKTFIYWTSSLSRSIGSVEAESFNNQMRHYARTNNKILFDVADIESHDPEGNPCYDNRDGVAYCSPSNPNNCENYPDDGLNIPAICPHYTTEINGGHLGSYSTGMNRIAKAFWVLMAQIAGWQPNYSTPSPTPLPSVTSSPTPTPTPTPTQTATLLAQWSFNQPNSVEEDLHGCSTCQNFNASWTSEGRFGGAYQFNGVNSYLKLNDFPYLNNATQFTFSVWIKPDFDHNSSEWRYIFNAYNMRLFYLGTNRNFRFAFKTANGDRTIDSQNLTWAPNTWHLIKVTYDGINLKMYWDNNLNAFKTTTGVVTPNNNTQTYVGTAITKTNFFKGLIDEISVWNQALD